jgi:hypothetical protein
MENWVYDLSRRRLEFSDRMWVEDYLPGKHQRAHNPESSPIAETGVVATLNKHLAEDLTNPVTGIVNPRYWGMKEVKICALTFAWLKQDQIDEIIVKNGRWHKSAQPADHSGIAWRSRLESTDA